MDEEKLKKIFDCYNQIELKQKLDKIPCERMFFQTVPEGSGCCSKALPVRRSTFDAINYELERDREHISIEVKDAKKEVQSYLKRLEGPIAEQLEREKNRFEEISNAIRCCCNNFGKTKKEAVNDLELLQKEIDLVEHNARTISNLKDDLKENLNLLSNDLDNIRTGFDTACASIQVLTPHDDVKIQCTWDADTTNTDDNKDRDSFESVESVNCNECVEIVKYNSKADLREFFESGECSSLTKCGGKKIIDHKTNTVEPVSSDDTKNKNAGVDVSSSNIEKNKTECVVPETPKQQSAWDLANQNMSIEVNDSKGCATKCSQCRGTIENANQTNLSKSETECDNECHQCEEITAQNDKNNASDIINSNNEQVETEALKEQCAWVLANQKGSTENISNSLGMMQKQSDHSNLTTYSNEAENVMDVPGDDDSTCNSKDTVTQSPTPLNAVKTHSTQKTTYKSPQSIEEVEKNVTSTEICKCVELLKGEDKCQQCNSQTKNTVQKTIFKTHVPTKHVEIECIVRNADKKIRYEKPNTYSNTKIGSRNCLNCPDRRELGTQTNSKAGIFVDTVKVKKRSNQKLHSTHDRMVP